MALFHSILNRRTFGTLVSVAGFSTMIDGRQAFASDAGCAVLAAYPVPAGSHPREVAPSVDGVHIWFTAEGTGSLGRLNPLTGDTDMIDLGKRSAPHGVVVGTDGCAWVVDQGRAEIQRVDPESGSIDRFETGVSKSSLRRVAQDLDGRIWFCGQHGLVGVLQPESGEIVITEADSGEGQIGIHTSLHGAVWIASEAGNFLGSLQLKRGSIRISEIEHPSGSTLAGGIWSDAAGDLWLSQRNPGRLGRYSPDREEWGEWQLPDQSDPAAVYVDESGIVWTSEWRSNAIVRFEPETKEFASIPLPHIGVDVRQLIGRPGEIWGAEPDADHLFVIRTVCAGP